MNEFYKNRYKKIPRMFNEVSKTKYGNKKGISRFFHRNYHNLHNIKSDNTSQIYDDSKIYEIGSNKEFVFYNNVNTNNSSITLDTQVDVFNDSKVCKIESDSSCDICTKFENSNESLSFDNIDAVLKTCDVYNKDIYISKDALRLYFDEKKDSELYFFVNSVLSLNKNDNIIYPEIYELYVNIEFELEKISKGIDKIILCCGKCHSGSIAVSPICTIRVERTEYLLDEAVPLSLDVQGINEMTYREIMESVKRMEKLCITGKKWLRIFNNKKKGYDNTFRFQNYIIEHGLNTENRPNSLNFLKKKISSSILRYRRSWPDQKKIHYK
ncbi:hypothetical protein PORY_001785 [Pneumocystis oryctolagi]|uniref:Uncharacterized protein n=1 Tax=Pneumocystis oryctolagi TaxID=42067 RepID=A0ACB7CCE1_9ASCO|nr:hypothetical protein PORY_001785 [Pneumocystis oryctolagi]